MNCRCGAPLTVVEGVTLDAETRGPHFCAVGAAASRRSEATPAEVVTEEVGRRLNTETRNAERFAEQHGRDVRYVPPLRRWLIYDGTRWRTDEIGHVTELAKQTARRIYSEAAAADDSTMRRTLGRWAAQSESAHGISAMLKLAQSSLAVLPSQLDRDPWLLNTPGCTVDLRTGKRRSHRREDLITKVTGANYRPDSTSDVFENFLRAALPDVATRLYVQKCVGMSLSGQVLDDIILVVYGPGGTGKTTLKDAVSAALGDYAKTADIEAFVQRRGGGARPEIAALVGARMVAVSEAESNHRLAMGLLKQLSSGERMATRGLYQDPFEFTPQITLWILTNERPRIPDTDSGAKRRLREVGFTEVFDSPDPDIRRQLREPRVAGEAVLAWAIDGCLKWQGEGLREPEAVTEATESFWDEMDKLARWIEECCQLVSSAWTSISELRTSYRLWCERDGSRPLQGRAFAERLRHRALSLSKRRGVRGWEGIGLLSPPSYRTQGQIRTARSQNSQ